MWELDCEESWALKNWCFWTVVLEKTLESPLDCKEIQPVHSKGDQPWMFFGRNDDKAETPILWSPHAKSWLIGKDSEAGRDWGQEEKGTTEDEMAGWHHRLDGCWVWVNSVSWWWTGRPGVLQFMGSQRVGHDWATELNWTLNLLFRCRSSLYILDINPYLKIFFLSVWVVFSFSWYSNFMHKSFYFDEINIFFLLLPVFLMFNPRSHYQTQYYKDVFPVFSSKGFTALALMLKCMVNFNFCMWCKLRVDLHSLACGHVVFHTVCWKEVLSLLNGLGTLAENQLTIYMKVYFWAILCHLCLSLCHIILFW